MNMFDIELAIKQPTRNQLTSISFMIDYKQVAKDANSYRSFLLDYLNAKIDFSSIPEKEVLIVKVKRDGRKIVDYASIKNRKVKQMIKLIIEEYYSK